MKKLNSIIKIIFECGLIFLIFYIWLNFFLKSKPLSCVLSLIMSLIIEGVIYGIKQRHKNFCALKEEEKLASEKMFSYLVKEGNCMAFFSKLFSCGQGDIKKYKNHLIITREKERILVTAHLKFQPLSQDEVISIYHKTRGTNPTKIIILCGEADSLARQYAKSLSIPTDLLDKYQTYSLLYKEYDFYPNMDEDCSPAKPHFKDIFNALFSPSHAKGFIFSALFLLMGSLFTKMNLYYLIFSSLLLVLGLVCMFNNKKEGSYDLSI